MITAWTKNLRSPADKKEFEEYLLGSAKIIDRLYEIVLEEEENLNRIETNTDAFKNPSWSYMQAYYNGFRACLRLFKKLLTLDHKENNG